MTPEIRIFPGKRLAGFAARMSFTDNRTSSLWQQLMPRRHTIEGRVGTDLFSLEVYDPCHFKQFDPSKDFEKWAGLEIGPDTQIPDGLRELKVPPGLYAVFLHSG